MIESFKRLVCCAALALLASGCTTGRNDPAKMLETAVRYQAKGEHAAAIVELRNLLAAEPQSTQARRLLALSYLENGEPGAAEDELRKAIDYGLDRRSAALYLARALLLQGKHERLLEEIQPEPDMSRPDAIEFTVLRGLASLALGNVDDARILLERAIKEDAVNSDALLGLAALAVADDRKDQAGALLDRAVQANPENVDAWLVRGDFHRLQDKPLLAIEDYRRALALKPNNVNANLQLAGLYVDQRKFDEARKHVEAIRAKNSDNAHVNYLYALIEFQKKNHAGAREALEKSLRRNPQHLASLLLAGTIEYATANYSAAIPPLRDVLDRAPGVLVARRLLSGALLRTGQVQRAVELLEQTLAEAPDDSGLLTMLAEAHLQNNELERAIPLLERASKTDPKNAQTRHQLQIARLLGGQSAVVLADLEATTKIDQTSPISELLLTVTLIQRRQFERALQTLSALEKTQKSAIIYNLKAAALIGIGKPDDARRALENALALNPQFVTALVNLANLDLREQGPHAARKRLEGHLQREPKNAQVLIALAQMGPRLGAAPDLIVEWLQRAHAVEPGSLRPLLLLADAHLRLGDVRKALQYAEQAQTINPDQTEVLSLLADIQSALGQTSAALGLYSRLALQNPKSAGVLYRLARAQAANNNAAAAVLTLRRALEITPGFMPALSFLGELELQAGRSGNALQIAQQMRRLDPRSPDGYLLEGDIQGALKNPAQAAALYAEAYARGERSAAYAIKNHMLLKQAGRDAEADAFLVRFAREFPDALSVHAYMGDEHLSAGRYAAATERYRKVLQQQPQNALVLNNLAWASYLLKDRRAIEYAQKAHALRPDHPVVLDTLGWLLVESGQTDRGLELLQRAVTLAPEHPETRYHLVQGLVKTGDLARARRELEALLTGKAKFEHEAQARELLSRLR